MKCQQPTGDCQKVPEKKTEDFSGTFFAFFPKAHKK
jgi:hypothetical protein